MISSSSSSHSDPLDKLWIFFFLLVYVTIRRITSSAADSVFEKAAASHAVELPVRSTSTIVFLLLLALVLLLVLSLLTLLLTATMLLLLAPLLFW